MRAHPGRDPGAGHLRVGQAAPRHRLLPAHRGRRGAHVRRREDPRRLLPARGSAVRDGDPYRPPDRPAAPPTFKRRLQRRSPGGHHRAVGRHGQPVRHPGHQRRGPRRLTGRPAVRRADRRGAARPDRRAVEGESHVPGARARHVRRGGRRPAERPGRGRRPHGGGRGPRGRLGPDPAGRDHAHRGGPGGRPRRGQAVHRRARRLPARLRGRGRRHRPALRAHPALHRRRVGGGRGVRRPAHRRLRWSPARPSARRTSTPSRPSSRCTSRSGTPSPSRPWPG